jgi:phosphoribosyl 1,2-cyclic phosphate phosphodiesterase
MSKHKTLGEMLLSGDFAKPAEQKLDLLVIDCSFVPGSEKQGHNNVDDVLEIDKVLQPKRMVLTHIGHDLDIWLKANHHELPLNIVVGKDGMMVHPPR